MPVLKNILLVCHVSPIIGLGHLSRLLALAQALKKEGRAQPEFLIFGDRIDKDGLADFKITFVPLSDDFITSVETWVEKYQSSVVIFDLYPKHDFTGFNEFLVWLKKRNIHLVAVDSLLEFCNELDLIWIPSFNFDASKYANCTCTLKSGWDSFLIQKRLPSQTWKKGSRILILTGGGDVAQLGNTLPFILDEQLAKQSEIHWVQGPYAESPCLPDKTRLSWTIHHAPTQLDELITQSNYVLAVFGVSFFEVLQYGIPTVVFSPYGSKDNQELMALADERVALVASDTKHAVKNLVKLMDDDSLSQAYSKKSLEKLSVNGTQQLAEAVCLMGKV